MKRTPMVLVLLALLAVSAPLDGAEPGEAAFLTPLSGRAVPVGPTSGPTGAVLVDTTALPGPTGGTVPIEALGIDVDVEFRQVESRSLGRAWRGEVDGLPGDAAVVVEHQGIVSGSISTPDGLLVISTDSSGTQYAHLVDPSELGGEAGDMAVPPVDPRGDGAVPRTSPEARGPGTIDLLVVYTDDVQAAIGGVAQADAFAAERIEEMNTAAQNSGMDTRFRLLGTMKVDYAEQSDGFTHLNELTFVDGVIDQVHTARDSLGADLVHLITETTHEDNCGLAWRPPARPLTDYDEYGFSVATRSCSLSQASSTHEVGHNLGSRHDHDQAEPDDEFAISYSIGHFVPGEFGTIMARAGICACGNRILHFSNPEIGYGGAPTGVPIGDPAEAYNAAALDEVASEVADFRIGPPLYTSPCQSLTPTHTGTDDDDVIVGTAGDDVIHAKKGNDEIDGGGGDDVICADEGDDIVDAGEGADTVYGGPGADVIKGGDGNDRLHGDDGDDILRGQDDDDKLFGGDGQDKVLGGTGDDTVRGQGDDDTAKGQPGDDRVLGGAGTDRVLGGGGSDTVKGQGGNDTVKGQGGPDIHRGGAGSDTIRGGGGDDTMLGQGGDDRLIGQAGIDTANGGPGTDICDAETVSRC